MTEVAMVRLKPYGIDIGKVVAHSLLLIDPGEHSCSSVVNSFDHIACIPIIVVIVGL